MNRVGNIFALLISISLTVFIGCSDKGTEPDEHTTTFPLTAGTHWTYYSITDWHFMGDSTNVFSDTNNREITVEGPDTILGMPDVCTMTEFTSHLHMEGFGAHRSWIGFSGTALEEYVFQRIMPDDDPIYYSPSRTILDLPLTPGKSWIYSRQWSDAFDDTVIYSKTVSGSEVVTALGNSYNCDIVNNIAFTKSNDSLIYEIQQFYCNEGLIYEKMQDEFVYILNEHGDIIDSAWQYYHTELVEIDIR